MPVIEPPLPAGATDMELLLQVVRVHRVMFQGKEGRVPTARLYDWWVLWNEVYFQSRLAPIVITEAVTEYGKYLGYCEHSPERRIVIQQRSIKTVEAGTFAAHHGKVVRRHEAFEDVSEQDYNIALLLLHEMMHQALSEAGVDPGHESQGWAAWCNVIGMDLGLTLTYSPLVRGKTPMVDGRRQNVWKPGVGAELLPGTTRFAEFDEQRRFPWQTDAPFLLANTKVLTRGRLVEANGGQPVEVLPEF